MARWRKAKLGNIGTKRTLEPSDEEKEENPKSKSAKLYSFLFD
jgi:16S rRNA C1402 N4-methylase RsmH